MRFFALEAAAYDKTLPSPLSCAGSLWLRVKNKLASRCRLWRGGLC